MSRSAVDDLHQPCFNPEKIGGAPIFSRLLLHLVELLHGPVHLRHREASRSILPRSIACHFPIWKETLRVRFNNLTGDPLKSIICRCVYVCVAGNIHLSIPGGLLALLGINRMIANGVCANAGTHDSK